MATRDERWEAHRAELEAAARHTGVDVGTMVRIAGFESGYNPAAQPIARDPARNTVRQFDGTMAISSAYGYGQFTGDTWNQMIRQYGEQYGIAGAAQMTRAQTDAPEIRANTGLQAAMLAEHTRDNMAAGARLGGPNPDANVYAMHNLGGGDGPTFLNALRNNPNQRVDAVLSDRVISGNPALYGDGSRTVAEAYAVMGQHMARYDGYAQQAQQGQPAQNPAAATPGVVPPAPHAPNAPAAPASADGVLRRGEHGSDVRQLQEQLNALGAVDARGRPLTADGNYGERTREAVQSFQRTHGLDDDGIAGPATLEAIKRSSNERAPLLNNPNHPDHAMYNDAVKGLEKLGPQAFKDHDALERAAATMTYEARVSGLNKIDHVVQNANGTGLFAVQGELNDPAHKRVVMDKQQAENQPIQQSSQQLQQDVAQPARTQEPQQVTMAAPGR
ncbi:XVIPCD domain-containing protein [Lysobacter sp. TAB13]|uniref:XVIPCD domain-containing protein n=1 Tax=Lysobacter sp. TAB13 TaxID=3233065 RepID=UPI003F9759DC